MPKKKKTSVLPEKIETNQSPVVSPRPSRKKLFLVIVAALLAYLVWKNKSLFVVATINNMPISRIELDQIMVEQYGQQTLDNLITKKLVENEISKQNITVSDSEVDSKVKEVETTLPQGMSLEQALQMQGLSLTEFKNQLKLQIAVNKHFDSQVQISDQDIDNYIKENEALLTASDSASQREEARNSIKNSKISEMVNNWINDLRSQAKIVKYI